MIARCSIYADRPERCRTYPEPDDWIIPECTYTIDAAGVRHGECACGVGACCAVPREGGEPEGRYLPAYRGGRSCKRLVEVPASVSRLPIVSAGRERATVYVLDDMEGRVTRLRTLVAGHAVVWSTTVLGLFAALRRPAPATRLIILDHDLGPGSASHVDRNGHSGMAAATHAPIPLGVPALVWSLNGEGWAQTMRDTLILRGIYAVCSRYGEPATEAFIRTRVSPITDRRRHVTGLT